MLKADKGSRVDRADDEKTVRIARKRFARRQWARRWLAWRGLVALFVLLALVAGAVWLVFFSSVLAVSGATIEGNSVLDPREVRQAAALPAGEPLATVDLDAVAARIEGLAPVKSVDVSRAWPDKVRIAIRERVPVAVVEQDGAVRGLDREGVVFRDYPSAPRDLPLVRMSARTRADALAEAATVVGVLPADLAAKVDFVEVETIDTIALKMHNGRTILWGSADDSVSKAKVVAVLLDAAPAADTYDVTVPGQPTTR
jgi:cell division protein FtsQ